MEMRIPSMEEGRGGEPQRIGDILAEWLACYESRFPAGGTSIVGPARTVLEDQTGSPYPAELAMT